MEKQTRNILIVLIILVVGIFFIKGNLFSVTNTAFVDQQPTPTTCGLSWGCNTWQVMTNGEYKQEFIPTQNNISAFDVYSANKNTTFSALGVYEVDNPSNVICKIDTTNLVLVVGQSSNSKCVGKLIPGRKYAILANVLTGELYTSQNYDGTNYVMPNPYPQGDFYLKGNKLNTSVLTFKTYYDPNYKEVVTPPVVQPMFRLDVWLNDLVNSIMSFINNLFRRN